MRINAEELLAFVSSGDTDIQKVAHHFKSTNREAHYFLSALEKKGKIKKRNVDGRTTVWTAV